MNSQWNYYQIMYVYPEVHILFLLKNRANPEELALRLMYVYK